MKPETLDKVKVALRVSHTKLDTDIQDSIEGCLVDLKIHGIVHADDSDPLILNAIKLWCRSVHTDDTTKAAEFLKRYNALRDCLKVAEGYGWEAGDE